MKNHYKSAHFLTSCYGIPLYLTTAISRNKAKRWSNSKVLIGFWI